MKKYAILGYPLKHSFSPTIHNSAFSYLKLDAEYVKYEIEPSDFVQIVKQLKKEDWAGFNVTVPFKQAIIRHLDFVDPSAERIGAVNTIRIGDRGEWSGFNTDYRGFLEPLERAHVFPANCLILGAGGAARAVAFALAERCPLSGMVLVNRTPDRALHLKDDLKKYYSIKPRVKSIQELERGKDSFDLIVNTTSVGMGGLQGQSVLSPALFSHEQTVVYDLIYKPPLTKFLEQAREKRLRIINGMPMLLAQAALSFKIWTGLDFPEEVLHRIKQELTEETDTV